MNDNELNHLRHKFKFTSISMWKWNFTAVELKCSPSQVVY